MKEKTIKNKPEIYVRASTDDPRHVRLVNENWIIQNIKSRARAGKFDYHYGFKLEAFVTASLAELQEESCFVETMLGYLTIFPQYSDSKNDVTGLKARYCVAVPPYTKEEVKFDIKNGLKQETHSRPFDHKRTKDYIADSKFIDSLDYIIVNNRATAIREIIPASLEGINRDNRLRVIAQGISELVRTLEAN